MEKTEINDEKKESVEFYKNLKGKKVSIGGFNLELSENLELTISAISGVFSCKYAPGTLTWGLLVGFIGDNNVKPVENFIKTILYPSAMRFHDIDYTYVEDIIRAHSELTKRNEESGKSELFESVADFENSEDEENS
ncbi:MAG: hypothetical protein KBT03_11010 [Bacteroidales bacterium]|nr:hypothetical protein [Candidatus Scybalousia scybalohippi]